MNPELYIDIYYYTLLIIVLIYSLFKYENYSSQRVFAILLLIFVFCIITFRDIDPIFGDTTSYARNFEDYIKWGTKEFSDKFSKDKGFSVFTLFMAQFKNVTLYFGAIALVYLLPVYLAFKKGFNDYIFVALLLFICSFSFIGYGVNGLRQGMATSLIVAAMFSGRIWLQILFIIIATSFHGSALLPGMMFFIARFYNKPKVFLIVYVVFLFISLTIGEQLGSIISDWDLLSNTDERLQGYLGASMEDSLDRNIAKENFSIIGFRWDFMLYSLVPIVLGYIYLYKLNYKDRLYRVLYCTYVGSNACWLLTTYVPFNNRFAYLSWFMYSIIISFPLLKDKNLVDFQQEKIQLMVLLNYAFTFFMYIK